MRHGWFSKRTGRWKSLNWLGANSPGPVRWGLAPGAVAGLRGEAARSRDSPPGAQIPPTLEPRLGRGRLGFRPSSTHFRLQAAHSPDLGSRSPPLPLPESAVARSASHLNPDAAAASAHAPPTRGPAGLPLPPLPRPHSPPAPINGRLAARPIAFPATTNPAPGCP